MSPLIAPSPLWGFVELPPCVVHDIRELRVPEDPWPNLPAEVSKRLQGAAHTLLRIQNANRLAESVPDNRDWFFQIAIITDDYRHVESIIKRINQQMRGEVDVGTLLLRLDHAAAREPASPPVIGIRHRHLMAQKMSKVDADLGQRAQGAEISLLPVRLPGIVRSAAHPGREVAYRPDVVLGPQECAAQGVDIQPFIRRALKAAIIEIVAVNIDMGSHASPPKSSSGHKGRRAPRHRSAEGDLFPNVTDLPLMSTSFCNFFGLIGLLGGLSRNHFKLSHYSIVRLRGVG